MTSANVDHMFQYDKGDPIRLLNITENTCTKCARTEIEIPQLGPLVRTIRSCLRTFGVRAARPRMKRSQVAFFFDKGKRGVQDGAWGVQIWKMR